MPKGCPAFIPQYLPHAPTFTIQTPIFFSVLVVSVVNVLVH